MIFRIENPSPVAKRICKLSIGQFFLFHDTPYLIIVDPTINAKPDPTKIFAIDLRGYIVSEFAMDTMVFPIRPMKEFVFRHCFAPEMNMPDF
jgi:hypothetical protein